MQCIINPSALNGSAQVPGNKSGTARGIIFGSLANGTTILHNPLTNVDSYSIINMAQLLGAHVDTSQNNRWLIYGTGGHLKPPAAVLDAQNSGTGFYFFTAIASLIKGHTALTGDEQTCRRPVQPMLDAIRHLGGDAFSTRQNGLPPIVVKGPILGGECALDGTSSQWLSGFLIACPLAVNDTHFFVRNLRERPYVDMTVTMLHLAGITVENHNYTDFYVHGCQSYKPFEYHVPADWGSALFPLIAAAITASSRITLCALNLNDFAGERHLAGILREMGARITIHENKNASTHKSVLSDIQIEGGAELTGCEIDCSGIPDAVPILAVLGCFAKGKTVLTNIGSCRIKETDRAKTIHTELKKMGACIDETEETLTVYQSDLRGTEIDGHGDHRIVMAMTVAALGAKGQSRVHNAECVSVSFPRFFELFAELGAKIKLTAEAPNTANIDSN